MANTGPVLVFLVMLISVVGAQYSPMSAPSPIPALDCTSALLNMSSCLTYVEEGSNLTVPEKGCCPGLSSLVDNTPICLCELLSSGDTYGIQIDRTKALTLPTVCRVSTPPVSLCAVLGIPVASPMGPSMAPSSGSTEMPVGSSPSVGPGMPSASPPKTNDGNPPSFRVSGLAFLAGLACACAAIL